MKFRLYKHRTAPQVKVPLATPEIVELSEILTQSLSIHDYYESSPKIRNNPEENSPKQQTRGWIDVLFSMFDIEFEIFV